MGHQSRLEPLPPWTSPHPAGGLVTVPDTSSQRKQVGLKVRRTHSLARFEVAHFWQYRAETRGLSVLKTHLLALRACILAAFSASATPKLARRACITDRKCFTALPARARTGVLEEFLARRYEWSNLQAQRRRQGISLKFRYRATFPVARCLSRGTFARRTPRVRPTSAKSRLKCQPHPSGVRAHRHPGRTSSAMHTTPHHPTVTSRAAVGKLPPRGTILSILGDAQFGTTLETSLVSRGFTIVRARHAMHGVWLAITGSPDAILTDQIRPNDESNYLLDCLKRNPRTAMIPVVSMVDSLRQSEPAVSRLGEVAACYLKDSPVDQLIAELDRQIAIKASHAAVTPVRTDASRFDAIFAELGHSSPKGPWAHDGFFGSDVLDPAPTLFPSGIKLEQPHDAGATRTGKAASHPSSLWSRK